MTVKTLSAPFENACNRCMREGRHPVTVGSRLIHLCCIHYQELICKKNELCEHNTGVEYKVDKGIIKGRHVTVFYRVTSEENQKQKREMITKVVVDSLMEQVGRNKRMGK